MLYLPEIKKEFVKNRENLFESFSGKTDAFKFSTDYSLLIEETIRKVTLNKKYNFVLASSGSFSRRELSPYSDIDLILISESVDEDREEITNLITSLWDSGIEASHTVRDFSDIQKYLISDLHTFTQFFETRFLIGNDKLYKKWNDTLLGSFDKNKLPNLLQGFIDDIDLRYKKYGDSPKLLEPNVKMSAGGLRDFQSVEWMFIFSKKFEVHRQFESTQAEMFIYFLDKSKITTPTECKNLYRSYKLILSIRNLLHLTTKSKTDRFEFLSQLQIAAAFGFPKNQLLNFMRDYFNATNIIHRFCKSMIKKFEEEIINPIPDSLSYDLDNDFAIKGRTIFLNKELPLRFSDILRGFYYRGLKSARFDESLRSSIIEAVNDSHINEMQESYSSVFFREILKLPKNVGITLSVMNELGVLSAYLPEFGDLNGFLQHGVYHCYTADEHTLITIQNLEKLSNDKSTMGYLFNSIKDKEILYLAMLFHDIAKPFNIPGHEIIGSEMAASIMSRLGYDEKEIDRVTFLVKNHLAMEQVAFRRNLNDPETLNNFTALFNSVEDLDLLYLVTYADLSAVNSAVWTSWKSELLSELYRKSKAMIEDKISGEELLYSKTYVLPKEISKHSNKISENTVQEHLDSLLDDISYASHFTDKEIARHIEEIEKGEMVSVLFNEQSDFTNITIITKDFPALLSKLCGVLTINDANIHDAKIFTRKDGIVIDTFNVTDFRTHKKIDPGSYIEIEKDFISVLTGYLQLNQEVAKLKSRWWRIESKFFKRAGQIKIAFEKHDRYTIIDVHSPDRLGFLYHITNKMHELGLMIYFAKISTKGDDIVDAFYVLDRNGNKVSTNDYEFIKSELLSTINQII